MKVILLAIFVVAALGGSLSQEDITYFNRLMQKDFGKTIIETMFLELKQEHAADHIISLLTQMLKDLRADADRAAQEIDEREQTCSDKINEIDAYVEQVKQTKADLERQVPLRKEELDDKTEQMQDNLEELERNKQRITSYFAQRTQEHEEYMERREEMTQLINALKTAKATVAQLQGRSFLEVQETVLTQLKSHHNALKNLRDNAYKSFGMILLELSTDSSIRADQDTVQVILDVIDELIESIYSVQKEEMYADDEKTRNYQTDLQNLQLENSRLVNTNVNHQAFVDHLQTKYDDIITNIGVQGMILENKGIERADWVGGCDDDRQNYESHNSIVAEQLETIQKIIDLLNANFNGVSAVLTQLMQ